jgi:hypothetical protein
MPHEVAAESMSLFLREVAPQFRGGTLHDPMRAGLSSPPEGRTP